MNSHAEDGARLRRQAAITFVVVVLAVAAFDDITTDNATSFPLERTMLAGAGIWFLLVATRLWREGHRVIGALSLGLLTIAALVQPTVGPRIATTPFGYLVTVATLAWFLALAGAWAVFAWRLSRRAA